MSEREWRFYIDDMIDFAEHVMANSRGLDQAGLVAGRQRSDIPALLPSLRVLRDSARQNRESAEASDHE